MEEVLAAPLPASPPTDPENHHERTSQALIPLMIVFLPNYGASPQSSVPFEPKI